MSVKTIEYYKGALRIIDQTRLPHQLKYVNLRTVEEVWEAIRMLRVRGAPALGIAAAYGAYIGARGFKGGERRAFVRQLHKVCRLLESSRPTAVNLFSALEEVRRLVEQNQDKSVAELKRLILKFAQRLHREDLACSQAIGEQGLKVIKNGWTILTHCNTGGLATGGMGTALAVAFAAKEKGWRLKMIATETRPLLQGARLTTWELMQNRIPVTLICDTMVADVMARGKVNCVIVGADRITRRGDVANKIGTLNLAVIAHHCKIPFYVAAPLTTFDPNLRDGNDIPIEQRDADEVRGFGGQRVAPKKVRIYNPAFDVTPHQLVKGIITERGVLRPPYEEKIRKFLRY